MSRSLDMTPVGLPHSEIPGSKRACRSPRLIAACCVLHRLSVPRHPPSTLSNLTIKCLDLMRSAVESYGFIMHLFIYNPYSIVNERIWSRRPALPFNLIRLKLTAGLAIPLFLVLLRTWGNGPLKTAISAQPSDHRDGLVELIGIEPTTPCLQSRCSPN